MPQISASLPKDLIVKVYQLAKKNNDSFSSTIEMLVEKGLKAQKNKELKNIRA